MTQPDGSSQQDPRTATLRVSECHYVLWGTHPLPQLFKGVAEQSAGMALVIRSTALSGKQSLPPPPPLRDISVTGRGDSQGRDVS